MRARIRKELPDKDIAAFERADKLDVPAAASVGRPVKGNNVNNTDKGNSAEQAIARIKRDHPELITVQICTLYLRLIQ
jgi:hypothetical protein